MEEDPFADTFVIREGWNTPAVVDALVAAMQARGSSLKRDEVTDVYHDPFFSGVYLARFWGDRDFSLHIDTANTIREALA